MLLTKTTRRGDKLKIPITLWINSPMFSTGLFTNYITLRGGEEDGNPNVMNRAISWRGERVCNHKNLRDVICGQLLSINKVKTKYIYCTYLGPFTRNFTMNYGIFDSLSIPNGIKLFPLKKVYSLSCLPYLLPSSPHTSQSWHHLWTNPITVHLKTSNDFSTQAFLFQNFFCSPPCDWLTQ